MKELQTLQLNNLYIGSTPISDISFQASSTEKTILVTQPAYGTISLSPLKSVYQLNDQVTASISVPEHYVFSSWTGDITGNENPKTFTVDKNYSIGATVIIDENNPPSSSIISINQPIGGTITLTPSQTSYYNGTSVKATLNLQSGYQFEGWSGSLSGTSNPITFTINKQSDYWSFGFCNSGFVNKTNGFNSQSIQRCNSCYESW